MELKPGTLVCYRGIWHGIILDVFKSEHTDKIILHILFVKNVYKNQRYDVIEYEPDAITPTTPEKIFERIGHYELEVTSQLKRFGLSTVDKGK